MRALGLCLAGALCLHMCGCANPGQPPSLDPFVGRTTVPPPGTGIAAPPNPYIQPNGGGVSPQSKTNKKRLGQATPEMIEADDSGWRGADAPKDRLVSRDTFQDDHFDAASTEYAQDDDSQAEQASYEETTADEDAPPEKPVRRIRPRVQADDGGAEVTFGEE